MKDIDVRDYYRLSDALPCEYQFVSKEQIENSEPNSLFKYSEEIQLLAEFRQLERQSERLIGEMNRTEPVLAEYLANLNQKMAIIGQRVLLNEIKKPEDFAHNLVDLSMGGAALLSQSLLPLNQVLALRVLFHEGAWVLTCYAQVCYSRMLESGTGFRSGIEFLGLPFETEKTLQRHLSSRQTEARRRQIREEAVGMKAS